MSESSGDVFGDIQDMVVESATSPEVRSISPGGPGGCLMVVLAILVLAVIGIAIFNALMGGDTSSVGDEIAVEGDAGSASGQEGSQSSAETGADWIPRDGTWDIENLPFLPACGPGSLGSGFQEGTIEVIDDGAFIIASGSQPGTASIELGLVDAGAGRLVYLGVEPITGMEMEMTFTSPTEMTATVSNGEQFCMERPAVGAWDREIGESDPDADQSATMPEWTPAGFPVAGGGQVSVIEAPRSKTLIIVVEDTHPTDVLFSIAEWAVEEGHPILERSATTLTIQLPENQVMYVEVVDIGNSNTQLTVTIEQS